MWKNYWTIYQQLEKEIIDISFYITFCNDHLEVYSSKLSDLLLRCCSECENAAKTLIDINNLTSTNKLNFPKCGKYLLSKYTTLNTTEVKIIWPYQNFSNLQNVPFSTWVSIKKLENPIWYKAYNSLKHNRNANIHEANLANVISALAGLFIFNLLLRKEDIESHNEWIEFTRKRIYSYSNFFSPEKFLVLGNGGTYKTLKLTI